MTDSESKAPPRPVSIYLLILSGIAAAYCGWIISLPIFPTQDGPIHLYYTRVLHALLFEQPGVYGHFYYVRHILPPYSLYYYALMLLAKFVPLATADKIVVCLYFVSFTFGFRYLATALGPGGERISLLATVLLLNWPLGMGFINFCLSVSLALWALGLWCRAAGREDWPRRIAFIALMYVIMLTHPVPMLAVFGFCGLELLIRFIRHRFDASAARVSLFPPNLLSDCTILLISTGTLVYVKAFTRSDVLKQVQAAPPSYWAGVKQNAAAYLLLRSMSIFGGHSIGDLVYKGTLAILLAGSVSIALWRFIQHRRTRVWTLGDTWLLASLTLIVTLPFVPPDLNGSHFFAARLVILIWISALSALSGAALLNRAATQGIAVFSIAITLIILSMAQARIGPAAKDIANAEPPPAATTGHAGLLLTSDNAIRPINLNYDPYLWSGAHLFRRTDSVLYNTPWLDLQIIPLGPREEMPTGKIDSGSLEVPADLRATMLTSAPIHDLVFSQIDFAIINHEQAPAEVGVDSLLQSDPQASHHWTCANEGWYSYCAPQP